MLRSISRDAPHKLSFVTSRTLHYRNSCRHQHWHKTNILYSTSLSRHYSPLNSSPESKLSQPPPPISIPQASRKPKIELRPGPIKPKPTASLTSHTPNAPVKSQEGAHVAPSLTLNKAKEEAQKDITDAEKHGILPPPPPGASWFRATLHKAIELAKFYYRGVKLIFSRRREIAAIRARIREGGPPLTRQEYRFIKTQKDDVNKVVPFLIIALLLEEVIPLIAIYAPFMLPSTCILPSQRARIEAKRAEKALNSSVNSKFLFAAVKAHAGNGPVTLDVLKHIPGAPTAVCSLLGLSTLGIDALRIHRIRNHLKFIAEDDQLLIQDAGKLSDNDLTDALAERGLLMSKPTHASKDKLLHQWLAAVNDQPTPADAMAARLTFIVSRQ